MGWVPSLLSRLLKVQPAFISSSTYHSPVDDHILKVRYLLLGGAIGGGGALARQYDDWKNNLPDAAWLKKAMPDVDLDKFRTSLLSLKDTVKGKVGEVEMDPALKAAGWDKYQEFRGWFDKRLDSAIQAAIEEGRQEDEEEER